MSLKLINFFQNTLFRLGQVDKIQDEQTQILF